MELSSGILDYGALGLVLALIVLFARYIHTRDKFLEDLVKSSVAEKDAQTAMWKQIVKETVTSIGETNGSLKTIQAIMSELCKRFEDHDVKVIQRLERGQ